ncbi:MAG: DUF4129 domain-containing protein [bacterium]|nr:DUF4129 domain-containing protein [bacterium]
MKRIGLALLVAIAVGAAVASTPEAEPFRRAADRLDELLATSDELSAADARARVSEIRDLLLAEDVDPALVRSLVPLSGSLRGDAGDRRRRLQVAQLRLREFGEAVERPVPEVSEDARGTLDRILEDPEFSVEPAKPGGAQRLFRQVRNFFGRWMQGFANVAGALGRPVVMLMTLVLLALVLWFVARAFWPTLLRDRSETRRSGSEVRRIQVTAAGPRELLRRAQSEFEAGRFVPAMKLVEQAALLALVGRGVLPDRAGLTDREGVRWLRERAAADSWSDFAELAELHERLVYAGRAGERETVSRAVGLATGLVERAEREAA